MTTPTALLARARLMPMVAILRGLDTASALAIGKALYASGFRTLEVPLNRPGALECIAILADGLPPDAIVGGGTMMSVADVDAVAAAGGRLMVSPHCAPPVIAHAVAKGMLTAPGVATPTEAFAALNAGAHALKVFPSEMVGYGGLKALKSVLPAPTDVWPVGGITPDNIGPWVKAGATGFGIGSQLYAPGSSAGEVSARAQAYMAAWAATRT
jgi:2-dehydro-3-deoxyphosphogalactonate aldolase